MKRVTRAACSILACALIALGVSGRAAPAPAWPAAERSDGGAAQQLTAERLDAPLPFLAASGPLDVVPVEASRTSSTRATQRFGSGWFEPVRLAAAAALRVRTANHAHAGYARALAVARAGRTELHSTPPPRSVS